MTDDLTLDRATYLQVAARVLAHQGHPLSVRQIVHTALGQGWLTTAGRTPQHTMRARLSTDLRSYGQTSVFQRTGRNRFALREWGLPEYVAPPFRKGVPKETVVCLPSKLVPDSHSKTGLSLNIEVVMRYLCARDAVYLLPRRKAEQTTAFRQIIAYVALFDPDGNLISYVRGAYSAAPELLRGRRCVGFGGHVLDIDRDNLFDPVDGGLWFAANREIAEELKGINPKTLEPVALIWDSTSTEGLKHVAVLMKGTLPASIDLHAVRRELSIAGVRALSPAEAWTRFHELEFWSQLVVRHFFSDSRPRRLTRVLPSRAPRVVKAIVVVGEIGTGKTTLCTRLAFTRRFRVISTRKCVAKLIGFRDFGVTDRQQFQERAQELVASQAGIEDLAKSISDAAQSDSTMVSLIDGLRNVATLASLRRRIGNVMVLYLDTPRDLALSNFMERSGGQATAFDFIRAREHPVESEVPEIRHEADALLFNAGTVDDLLLAFNEWWQRA